MLERCRCRYGPLPVHQYNATASPNVPDATTATLPLLCGPLQRSLGARRYGKKQFVIVATRQRELPGTRFANRRNQGP